MRSVRRPLALAALAAVALAGTAIAEPYDQAREDRSKALKADGEKADFTYFRGAGLEP